MNMFMEKHPHPRRASSPLAIRVLGTTQNVASVSHTQDFVLNYGNFSPRQPCSSPDLSIYKSCTAPFLPSDCSFPPKATKEPAAEGPLVLFSARTAERGVPAQSREAGEERRCRVGDQLPLVVTGPRS
jgi:hypothetical protein